MTVSEVERDIFFIIFVTMLTITKYIKDLLFLHDCVILPGFGGFVANYHSAEVDVNRNVFLPPRKDIGFNRNLSQNDGLLISRMIKAEKMSYQEAEKAIAFFVEDLTVRVHRGEQVDFDGVGRFFYDKRHNLLFEPDRQANFLVDALGMDKVVLPYVSKEQMSEDSSLDIKQIFSIFTPARLRYAALGIPVLLGLAILPLASEREGNIELSSLNPVTIIESNSLSSEVLSKPEISDDSEMVRFDPKEREIPTVASHRFFLIAGSFEGMENAKVLRQELQARDYPAQIIENKGLFSVVINVFDSYEAASNYKNRVIAKNPKASFWVLKK